MTIIFAENDSTGQAAVRLEEAANEAWQSGERQLAAALAQAAGLHSIAAAILVVSETIAELDLKPDLPA
jgi:hypothetical protein